MGFLSLAISIGRDIERVGSLAGYASILGLAILSLLYFAQSREVKRLREWAGRAPERDAELQQRVAEDAARRASGGTPAPAVPRPAGANVPATAAAQAAARPATPGTPPVVPPKPAVPGGQAPKPTPGAPPAAGTPKPAVPGAPPAAGAPKPVTPGPVPGAPPAAGTPKPVVPPPVPGKGPTTPAPATAAAAARPRRTVTVGSTPSSATVPPRRDPGKDNGSGVSGRAIGAGVLGVALVVVVLLVSGVLGGGGDEDPGTAQATTATTTTTDAAAAIPEPGDTAVAVLNGTTITGLARNAADDLEAGDYSVIRVTDAADQAQQVSQVAYSEGFEGSARRIARIVGIDSANILPLDASTRVVAGEDASVVVTMGADKAE